MSYALLAQTRQWTSGRYKVEAEFVELTKDGTGVILKNAKGVKVTVPLKQLSQEDQDWIAAYQKEGKSRSGADENPFGALSPEAQDLSNKAHEKYALLVGVNSYEHLPSLQCAVSDTELLRDSLLKLGFKEENIFILKTSTDVATTPTKDHIKTKIDEILQKAEEDDLIFFSFSGHGIQRAEVSYFCPQEAKKAKDENFTESLLSLTEVMEKLSENPARFKWVVVDACRNDPGRSAEDDQYNLQTINDPPRGIALMQSCSPKEKSWENKGHGLFTRYFSEALSGKGDANRDGRLTMSEVLLYTTYETNKESQRIFREPQRPRMSGDYSDFVIVDDLLIDGLTREEHQQAEDLYHEACNLRRTRKFKEAKEKIVSALDIYKDHQEYLDEQSVIEGFLQAEENLAKQKAEAERLAEEKAAAEKEKERLAEEKAKLEERQSKKQLPETYLNGEGQKLVLIPSGEFMMGDTLTPEEVDKKYPGGKVSWYEDAHPQHKVKLSKPYYMGVHEVTVGEFRKFVDQTGYETTAEKEGSARGYDKETGKWGDQKGLNWRNLGLEQSSNHPVVCVSWHDAKAYIKWLNGQDRDRPTGYVYCLPTEAEWENACRAGSVTDFFWGNKDSEGSGYLNAAGEEGSPNGREWTNPFPFNDGYKGTSPVGSFKPNGYGLYDILGNVLEWCNDWYGEDYYKKSPTTDPLGPSDGSLRVGRGGSWFGSAGGCRSAYRNSNSPGNRSSILGFRLALSSQAGR